jgi:hypothetical protein
MPDLDYSKITEVEIKADSTGQLRLKRDQENKKFEMIFNKALDKYNRRKEQYAQNLSNIYALLWSQCSAALQEKIKGRQDYLKIRDNPVSLLKTIREHAMDYTTTKRDYTVVMNALRAFLNCKQKDDELLTEFCNRFSTQREILNSHVGGGFNLTKIATSIAKDPNDSKQMEEAIKKTDEAFVAHVFLHNADQDKYGSLLDGLQKQYSFNAIRRAFSVKSKSKNKNISFTFTFTLS